MLISLILDKNRKVVNLISSGISSEKIKLFDTGLELTMSNLHNGRVNLNFNYSVLVQKRFSSSCSNFMLTLYIACELNAWPRNPLNNFTLKHGLSGRAKLVRKAIKSKFTYNCRGIAFDGEASLSFGNGFARNVVILGVDNSSLSHTNKRKITF